MSHPSLPLESDTTQHSDEHTEPIQPQEKSNANLELRRRLLSSEQGLTAMVMTLEEACSGQQDDDLSVNQMYQITHRILHDIEALDRQRPVQHEQSLRSAEALLESAETEIQDTHIFINHFEKYVLKGGIHPKTKHVITKSVLSYIEGQYKMCMATTKQTNLKNAYTRATLAALQSSRKDEVRVNERLKQSEAEELEIRIQQTGARYLVQDNAIRRLKYLVNDNRHRVAQQKTNLQDLLKLKLQIGTDRAREEAVHVQLVEDQCEMEGRLQVVQRTHTTLQEQRDGFRVPPVLEYARTNQRVEQLRKQAAEFRRKLEIVQIKLKNLRTAIRRRQSHLQTKSTQSKQTAATSAVVTC